MKLTDSMQNHFSLNVFVVNRWDVLKRSQHGIALITILVMVALTTILAATIAPTSA